MPAHTAPRSAASSMASPEPQATSSSRSPSSTFSWWWRATYSRQLAGSDRVAKSAAKRPQPSSTSRHWGVASWTVMRISWFGVGSSGFPWSAEMLLEVGGEQLGVGPDTGEQV